MFHFCWKYLLFMTFSGESDKTRFTFKAFMSSEKRGHCNEQFGLKDVSVQVCSHPLLCVNSPASVSIMASDHSVQLMPTLCRPAKHLRGDVFFISSIFISCVLHVLACLSVWGYRERHRVF